MSREVKKEEGEKQNTKMFLKIVLLETSYPYTPVCINYCEHVRKIMWKAYKGSLYRQKSKYSTVTAELTVC